MRRGLRPSRRSPEGTADCSRGRRSRRRRLPAPGKDALFFLRSPEGAAGGKRKSCRSSALWACARGVFCRPFRAPEEKGSRVPGAGAPNANKALRALRPRLQSLAPSGPAWACSRSRSSRCNRTTPGGGIIGQPQRCCTPQTPKRFSRLQAGVQPRCTPYKNKRGAVATCHSATHQVSLTGAISPRPRRIFRRRRRDEHRRRRPA